MSERYYTVEGNFTDLCNIVKQQFGITKELINEEENGDVLLQGITNTLTDALIRFSEGICTSLASQELFIEKAQNVQYVSASGVHALSFSRTIKTTVIEYIKSLPICFFEMFLYNNNNGLVFVSTFFQILISQLVLNHKKLEEEESSIYAFCAYEIYKKKTKWVEKDRIRELLNTDFKQKGKTVSEGELKQIFDKKLAILCNYGILDVKGNLIKIIF